MQKVQKAPRIHYGPIEISEYMDGFVSILPYACGYQLDSVDAGEALNFLAKISLVPADVNCPKCKKTSLFKIAEEAFLTSKTMTKPKLRKILHMRNSVFWNPEEFRRNEINALRTRIGMSPIPYSDEQLAEFRSATADKMRQYALNNVEREGKNLTKIERLRKVEAKSQEM